MKPTAKHNDEELREASARLTRPPHTERAAAAAAREIEGYHGELTGSMGMNTKHLIAIIAKHFNDDAAELEGVNMNLMQNYNIPKLTNLIKNAEKDSDPCSITFFGEHRMDDAEFAVIVVKGKEQTKLVAHMLETMKLYTPGKPIVQS